MEIKSSEYYKSVIYGLRTVLAVPFLIFGYAIIRFENINKATEAVFKNGENIIGILIFESVLFAILIWVRNNYSLITVNSEQIIIHGQNRDEILTWSNIESIKLYRADYRGSFVKIRLKNGRKFYTNTDLPKREGKLLDPNYHPTFSTRMAELLKSKKTELNI